MLKTKLIALSIAVCCWSGRAKLWLQRILIWLMFLGVSSIIDSDIRICDLLTLKSSPTWLSTKFIVGLKKCTLSSLLFKMDDLWPPSSELLIDSMVFNTLTGLFFLLAMLAGMYGFYHNSFERLTLDV